MSLPTVFYCSPTKAQQLGYTITKTHVLENLDNDFDAIFM